jgi:D-glycero-D-manno-heptose 1,7-bisphosphate phosphatase
MNPAVFLDRDGTIIYDRHYLKRPDQVEFFSGAIASLAKLQQAGFKLFIVSNQSGVGRGFFTLAEVQQVNDHLVEQLGAGGVRFEKIYIAPEAPDAPSHGRKPSPRFLFDARDEFGLNLANSYFIGDKLSDLECGWNAGLRKSILVRTGSGEELARTSGDDLGRALVVNDLAAAVNWILKDFEQVQTK